VCAVLMGYAAEFVYAGNESTDETEVDEGDEHAVVFGPVVGEEGADCPCRGEHADDEEDEDVVWCEGVVGGVDVHEVGQHAECWDLLIYCQYDGLEAAEGYCLGRMKRAYQSNYLHEAPKGEEDSEKHLDVCCLLAQISLLLVWISVAVTESYPAPQSCRDKPKLETK
jgi:hypothetical protein